MDYYDSHLHLQDPAFTATLQELIAESRTLGIIQQWVNSTSPSDWCAVSDLYSAYKGIVPFFGVHPWFSQNLSDSWYDELCRYVKSGFCGIGEIGLDRWKDGLDCNIQEEVFLRQFKLASELRRPVSIHCLKAWDWLEKVLARFKGAFPPFIVHSFGGSYQDMLKLLDYGGYLSFSASLIRSKRLQEVCCRLPLERLLLETDAPDMPLPVGVDFSGAVENYGGDKINSPLNLLCIYRFVADLRGIDMAELCGILADNCKIIWKGVDA